MVIIKLKKNLKTKTNNNSYNILIKNQNSLKSLGSYNQQNRILVLNLQSYIYLLSRGYKFSESFKKIFITGTANLSNRLGFKLVF